MVLSGSGPERSASEQVEICGGHLAQSPEVQGLLVLAPSSPSPHPFHPTVRRAFDTAPGYTRATSEGCCKPMHGGAFVQSPPCPPGSQLPARSTGHFLSAFSPPRRVLDSARCLSSGMGAARYVTGRADLVRFRGLPHVPQLAWRRMIPPRPPVPPPRPQLPGRPVQSRSGRFDWLPSCPVSFPVLSCPGSRPHTQSCPLPPSVHSSYVYINSTRTGSVRSPPPCIDKGVSSPWGVRGFPINTHVWWHLFGWARALVTYIKCFLAVWLSSLATIPTSCLSIYPSQHSLLRGCIL